MSFNDEITDIGIDLDGLMVLLSVVINCPKIVQYSEHLIIHALVWPLSVVVFNVLANGSSE